MKRLLYCVLFATVLPMFGCFPKPSVEGVHLSGWDYPLLQKTQNLRAGAIAAYDTKDYRKCIAYSQQIFVLKKGKLQDYYRTAKAYATIKNTDSAFVYLNAYLEMRISSGVELEWNWNVKDPNDTGGMSLKDDTVFIYLKNDARWDKITSTLNSSSENFKSKINEELEDELIALGNEDQRVRNDAKVSEKEMDSVDKSNQKKFDTIIKQYGMPGISTVGLQGVLAVFGIVQHYGEKGMDKYLPSIEKLSESGEFPTMLLAYLEDRNNMFKRKPQVYGTQFGPCHLLLWYIITKKSTLYPIAEKEYVDTRRAEAGMGSLKDYLKQK